MDLYFKIKKLIKENQLIDAGDHVLVGISGGIDSMSLLKIFQKISEDLGIVISVAHINHRLRSDSDQDEIFIRSYCEKYNIPCYTKRWKDHKKGDNIQSSARNYRYTTFSEIAEKNGANKLALAHNMNDQAETLLLNLIRGTTLGGLSGIYLTRKIKPELLLIRPLLYTKRSEIKKFAVDNRVDFREDHTNKETKYRRNYIRHELIPMAEKLNPSLIDTLCNTVESLQYDRDLLEEISQLKLNDMEIDSPSSGKVKIDINKFKSESESVRRWILKKAYKKVSGTNLGIKRDHILRIEKLAVGNSKQGEYNLPNAIKCKRKGELLAIFRE